MKYIAIIAFLLASPAQASFVDDLMDWIDPPSRWEQSPDGTFPIGETPPPDSFWSVYEGSQRAKESHPSQNNTPTHQGGPGPCCEH